MLTAVTQHAAASSRSRRAGGAGKRERQTAQAADGEIGESLRFERIHRPAGGMSGFDLRRGKPLGEHAHQGRIARTAAGDDPGLRRARQQRHDGGDRGRGERGQSGGAVVDAGAVERVARPCAEIVAVERFRRRQRKERMLHQARDHRLVDPAGRGMAAVDIERLSGAQPQEIVEQRIAWPGIAGDQLLAVDEGHVGDAADIEDRDRRLAAELAHQSLMKDRRQRRALPAGRDIGGAKIIDHGNAEALGEDLAVADLHRQRPLRPVQQRLAVKADRRRDRPAANRCCREATPPPRHARR